LSAPGCNTAHPAQGQRQIRQEAHVQKIWCYEVKRVSCTHAKLCMLASGETQYWTKKKTNKKTHAYFHLSPYPLVRSVILNNCSLTDYSVSISTT